MPIGKKPIIEYWFDQVISCGTQEIFINSHHHSGIVREYIKGSIYTDRITLFEEEELFGTAGTIKENYSYLEGKTLLLVHADNWCKASLKDFINFHFEDRPSQTKMTMMTFSTNEPEKCGVVKLDGKNIVKEFYEKQLDAPSRIANGAVYMIEPEITSWIYKNSVYDFSNEVIPNFLGKIATWHNENSHIDIGTIENLRKARVDMFPNQIYSETQWQAEFELNSIHNILD